MSDILKDNKILADRCRKYIELCESLEYDLANQEEFADEVQGLLSEAHLCIKDILCELQILKIQESMNSRITEKQILIMRNKFSKVISIYQKIFINQIPNSMQEVSKRIELLNPQYEESWHQDIRMLGLALTVLGDYAHKSHSYPIILNYQYQFTAIFRNSILCKNLRPKLGEDNRMCNLRCEQLAIFHQFADDQIAKQRIFYVRTQSIGSLKNAIRIASALVELGFVTEDQFFDTEYYKKQNEAFLKILSDARDSATK